MEETTTIIRMMSQMGLGACIVLTMLLVLIFLSAWKAPAWVKDLGSIAVAIALIFCARGVIICVDDIRHARDISPTVVGGGLANVLLPICYAIVICITSRIIALILSPRKH